MAALASAAMRHFEERGRGHLVGLSSLAALRGQGAAPAYNASKAFVSNYLDGLRHRAVHGGLDVTVTDVLPGFVDTPMVGDQTFWLAPVDKAAEQIYRAIRRRRARVYVTRRWRLVAWLLKVLPDALYYRAV